MFMIKVDYNNMLCLNKKNYFYTQKKQHLYLWTNPLTNYSLKSEI